MTESDFSNDQAKRYQKLLVKADRMLSSEERAEKAELKRISDAYYANLYPPKSAADVHPPVHPPVDSRAPYGETWGDNKVVLTPVHGSPTIFEPAVHPQ